MQGIGGRVAMTIAGVQFCSIGSGAIAWSWDWGGGGGMCGAAEETLLYLLEECVVLGGVREKYGLFRARDVVSFGSGDWDNMEAYLEEMWEVRKHVIGGAGVWVGWAAGLRESLRVTIWSQHPNLNLSISISFQKNNDFFFNFVTFHLKFKSTNWKP